MSLRVALLQLNASDSPSENLPVTLGYLRDAVADGAQFAMTPEVTNCVSTSRTRQHEVLRSELEDETLEGLRNAAAEHGVWVLIGSLALKSDSPDGRFVNRSFLVSPSGTIVARYDKIHMFDVAVTEEETYRESAGFRPGDKAVVADMDGTRLGLTVCYDLRFPGLFRHLAQAGASIISVPAAFSPVTGAAHWEPLLRARAIENGAFVVAPAQCGTHAATAPFKTRRTFGHSLVVSPWGEVIADGGDMPGVTLVDLDLSSVEDCRRRLPSLSHDRRYTGP